MVYPDIFSHWTTNELLCSPLGQFPSEGGRTFLALVVYIFGIFGDGLVMEFLAASSYWREQWIFLPPFPLIFPCCFICISFQKRKNLWLMFTFNYFLVIGPHEVELYVEESVRWGKWILHHSCQTYKEEVSEMKVRKINSSKAINSINSH